MATIQEINSTIIGGQFTNEQLDSISMAIKFARNQLAVKNKFTFVKGSKVKFTSSRNGKAVIGEVEKVNRKFVIVREKNSSMFGMQWRVPANMLEAA
jgi:exosome complex RNA-binding protein Csl4